MARKYSFALLIRGDVGDVKFFEIHVCREDIQEKYIGVFHK